MVGPPTISEWAGGREAFARWLDTFCCSLHGDSRA
jgi:hypothetical protein